MGTELVPELLGLDSWPVLEWIKGREPAFSLFVSLAEDAVAARVKFHTSRINDGEAIYSPHTPRLSDVRDALRHLRSAQINVHTVDEALVDEAVELESKYPFSYADAFAAARGLRLRAPLVTGDLDFRKLEAEGLLRLHWVGD